jgi:hypothetical protein
MLDSKITNFHSMGHMVTLLCVNYIIFPKAWSSACAYDTVGVFVGPTRSTIAQREFDDTRYFSSNVNMLKV